MAIIRSKIARQLLAEGGTPRKGFKKGSTGFEGSPEIGASKTDTSFSFGPVDTGDFGSESENIAQNLAARGIDRNQDTFMGSGDIGLRRSVPTAFNLATGAVINPMALAIDFLNRRRIAEEEEKDKGVIDAQLTGSPVFDYNVRMYNPETKRYDKTPRTTRFNDREESGDSQEPIRLKQPIVEKTEKPKSEFDDLLKFYGARFEDGGEVRQAYGLGSIVKKATRAVKKIVKSPVGKAALFGAAAFGLPAIGSFSGTPGFLQSELGKKIFLKDATKDFALSNLNPFSAITAASLLAGGLSKQDEEEDEKLPTVAQSDPEFQKFLEFYGGPRRFAESGGDIDEAPVKMAGYGYNEAMSDTFDMYNDMKKNGLIPPTMSFDEFLQEVVPEMSMKKDTSGMMASAVGDESDEISINMFGKPVKELNPSEFQELMDYLDNLQKKFMAKGGIASMAEGGMMASAPSSFAELNQLSIELFGRPYDKLNESEQEILIEYFSRKSPKPEGIPEPRAQAAEGGMMDLGGNEMDLRGGGFVPLGAKEKADDVPARLSKNEFVFTADAVRAAGGGSVDRGADIMYKTMKNLENKVA